MINGIWPTKNLVSCSCSFLISIGWLPFSLFLNDTIFKKLNSGSFSRRKYVKKWEACICLRESRFLKYNIQAICLFKGCIEGLFYLDKTINIGVNSCLEHSLNLTSLCFVLFLWCFVVFLYMKKEYWYFSLDTDRAYKYYGEHILNSLRASHLEKGKKNTSFISYLWKFCTPSSFNSVFCINYRLYTAKIHIKFPEKL